MKYIAGFFYLSSLLLATIYYHNDEYAKATYFMTWVILCYIWSKED